MSVCSDCRNENPAHVEFCQKCGAKLLRSSRSKSIPKGVLDQSPELVHLKGEMSAIKTSLENHRIGVATICSVLLPGLGQIYLGSLSGILLVVGWLIGVPCYARWCVNSISAATSQTRLYSFSLERTSLLEGLTFWHWTVGAIILAIWLGNVVYTASPE